jgi:hypothetical protein
MPNIMQAQQTPRPTHRYGEFYIDSMTYPEQLKFRRFGPQWSKKLHDDEEELLVMEKELRNGIAELRRQDGCGPLTTLDYPRILAKRDEKLYGRWMRYENKLRTHSESPKLRWDMGDSDAFGNGCCESVRVYFAPIVASNIGFLTVLAQDLRLVCDLYKMPVHGSYAGAKLNEHPNLFKNGTFGPTNELGGAAAYQDPKSPDFVAVVEVESLDLLTDLAIDHIVWIDKKILMRLRRWFSIGTRSNHIRVSTLIAFFDTIACIFVPLLLTATMFALARIQRLMVRIAVVGVFGFIFLASAKLLSGRVSRSSIFSLTAAYFAVASVFVSSTGDSAFQSR